jgi:small conductance mechanosensitive channel
MQVPAPPVPTALPSVPSAIASSIAEDLAAGSGTPDFARDWPGWAQWLIDKPLQIAVIAVAAVVIVAIGHVIVNRATAKLAAAPSVKAATVGRIDQPPAHLQERREARARTARSVVNSIITFAVWIIAVMLILERLGVNVAVLVTSLGVVGVGLGLGAQTLIKDIIAGLFMIIEDQYGIGDRVDTDKATGTVEHVSLRVTTLRADDGTIWYVPNGQVTRIGNLTQGGADGAGDGGDGAGGGGD